jgi:diaminopimelate decarboxylase
MTMASNYNGQPRPPELVVSGGVARVARRRETWEDLLAAETATGAPVAAAQGPADPLGW